MGCDWLQQLRLVNIDDCTKHTRNIILVYFSHLFFSGSELVKKKNARRSISHLFYFLLDVRTALPEAECSDKCFCVSVSVRLPVCEHISRTKRPDLTEFYVHVACDRGSILSRRGSDTLCISGFIDDVIIGPVPACRMSQRRRYSVVRRLTPLLFGVGCVLSQTPAGAKTGRIYHARGAGIKACDASR